MSPLPLSLYVYLLNPIALDFDFTGVVFVISNTLTLIPALSNIEAGLIYPSLSFRQPFPPSGTAHLSMAWYVSE